MNDNIDKGEIRKAIDRLQTEHPCGIAYDPIAFVNMEAVNTIKDCVDKIARRMIEDTEINIICEFAKLYLEGVRPIVEPKQGEWIPCSERLPKPDNYVLVCSDEGNIEVAEGYISTEIEEFVWLTSGWRFGTVIAWMPLPEPYKQEDEHGS